MVTATTDITTFGCHNFVQLVTLVVFILLLLLISALSEYHSFVFIRSFTILYVLLVLHYYWHFEQTFSASSPVLPAT